MLKKTGIMAVWLIAGLAGSSAFAAVQSNYASAVCTVDSVSTDYYCCSTTTHSHGSDKAVAFYPVACSPKHGQDGTTSGVGIAESACTERSSFVMENPKITGSWIKVRPQPSACTFSK